MRAARLDAVRYTPRAVAVDDIQRGRACFLKRAWAEAHAALTAADRTAPLGAEDLERLALSAYLLGREDEHVACLDRAHHAHLAAGERARAARCAVWAGLSLALRGKMGSATGWFARARRIVDRHERDCAERGYLLIPEIFQQLAAGDPGAAHDTAAAAAEIADRFGDRDLLALAVHEQGHALLEQGRVEEGLRLLDEAMVAVTADQLSPMVTGLVYCSVIDYCRQAYALSRAQEWTAAMAGWCEEQPDLVAFTGRCRIHRAEILQLRGAWSAALKEAVRAGRRSEGTMAAVAAEAAYRCGEIHRLRGELDRAEEAYRAAGEGGWEPQPGLALLRLAQGHGDAAATMLRRVLAATRAPRERAAQLPACVEILLATGASEEAEAACRELEEIASALRSPMLDALAAHARGAVALARGEAAAALSALQKACGIWQELEAPYERARARVLIALGCRALGDEDTAALELQAARGVFAELGAAPDGARAEALGERGASPDRRYGLTRRELQVLALVAAGSSNREIAAELCISEHTVARHLQNLFAKLDVSSRTAASALALKHKLV